MPVDPVPAGTGGTGGSRHPMSGAGSAAVPVGGAAGALGGSGGAADGLGGQGQVQPGNGGSGGAEPQIPTEVSWLVLSDDGGYSWFESPRAIVHGTQLVVGTVASNGNRRGDVEAIVHDLVTRETTIINLHDAIDADDHNSAAFALRPDGSLLAMYARHDLDSLFYYRISEPNDAHEWRPERTYEPSSSTRVTYANPILLAAEENRIYNFYRGFDASFKPSYAYSDDLGESWVNGGIFIDVPAAERHRPYVHYESNGIDTVHFLYTEGHPRDFDNSLYHAFYRAGNLYGSDGTLIAPLATGMSAPNQGTRVVQGNADNVAWLVDFTLDPEGRPHAVYSMQVGSAGLPRGQGGDDIRFRFARYDGQAWVNSSLCYAGSRLFSGEDDYSGLAAFDPDDLYTVYVSTDADPENGTPLISSADGQRHHELFVAKSDDQGASWSFTPITQNSSLDHIRPLVVRAEDGQKALIWLAGSYGSYTEYDLSVTGLFFHGSLLERLAAGEMPAPPL